jgi:hypothetical protein
MRVTDAVEILVFLIWQLLHWWKRRKARPFVAYFCS